MKLVTALYIAMVLCLLCSPAHSTPLPADPWEPELTIEWPSTFPPFDPIIRTDHFRVKLNPHNPLQVRQLLAFERLFHDLETRVPVATPEPITVVLLGSGLVGIAVTRRKRKNG